MNFSTKRRNYFKKVISDLIRQKRAIKGQILKERKSLNYYRIPHSPRDVDSANDIRLDLEILGRELQYIKRRLIEEHKLYNQELNQKDLPGRTIPAEGFIFKDSTNMIHQITGENEHFYNVNAGFAQVDKSELTDKKVYTDKNEIYKKYKNRLSETYLKPLFETIDVLRKEHNLYKLKEHDYIALRQILEKN